MMTSETYKRTLMAKCEAFMLPKVVPKTPSEVCPEIDEVTNLKTSKQTSE